jgi:hypothetical protein
MVYTREDHLKSQETRRKLFMGGIKKKAGRTLRAFDMLQARFAIVRGPACFWDMKSILNIMNACVIFNIIIQDERDKNLEFFFDNIGSCIRPERDTD